MSLLNSMCPFCGQGQQLAKSMIGQRVRCPSCRMAYIVHARSESKKEGGRWRRTIILSILGVVFLIACGFENYRLDQADEENLNLADLTHETAILRNRMHPDIPVRRFVAPEKASRVSVYFLGGAGLAFIGLGIACMPTRQSKED